MSLNSLAAFSGRRPLTVIAAWIIIMITAGILSFFLLESALGGNGQGSTKDLEFKLAKDLKDSKMSELDLLAGLDDSSESGEPSSDNLLVVTSTAYTFPSEEYFLKLNEFFIKVQSEIDKAGVNENVGALEDYQIIPSEDATTVMIQAPFVKNELVGPLVHITEDFASDEFKFYFIGAPDVASGGKIPLMFAFVNLKIAFLHQFGVDWRGGARA
mgnify:CR=1 FL=1